MASVGSASPTATGPAKRRKLPACDPCRFSKMACDHGQPICARCTERDRADSCIYRSRPFKKKRDELSLVEPVLPHPAPNHDPEAPSAPTQPTSPISVFLTRPHRYPNPGYLGRSSHTTVFGHLSPDQEGLRRAIDRQRADIPGQQTNEAQLARGTDVIDRVYRFSHIPACFKLVKTWLATGANLALAASFTEQCTWTAERLLSPSSNRSTAAELSSNLFMFSCRPLDVDASTTLETFCSQFNGDSARWETLAFFFISVSRALLACRSWAMPPFDTRQERCKFQTLFMHFADSCIDICLSLDCLNDLHLVLQYENYILHSLIDGDQSFETWRRLGDLISCLLALGYHEEMDGVDSLPGFVTSLRKTAYAYSYTADKNLSIFLGRPPRIHPKFCRFRAADLNILSRTENEAPSPLWDAATPLDFQAEAFWSATCAALKEEILHLFSESSGQHRSQKASLIMTEIGSCWASLPPHFRLEGKLKSCDRTSLEIALLLDTKLNYLHMLFLVRLALMRNIFETDDGLFAIASDMFELVIEAVMLKDKVTHGSTSLVWKVSYFGLASAGTICLSLLQPLFLAEQTVSVRFKIFQNLSILIAEVESGTLVAAEDANYALLASATQTITSVLQNLLSGRIEHQQQGFQASSRVPTPQTLMAPADEPWSPWRHNSFQDFEVNFWHTLAEHPSLVGDEAYPNAV